ncbi:winged helix-turn-helix domain-containing protein [Methylophaga sp. OBS1]|jgi:molybdate transport system regulatory protein|uniref:winged helix-turn-helix domain-containing protein n=1 Tax=Methylophaga sp. OBS1 TaxID=2991933 RepID=UPI002259EAE2|nr:LysR family transcriptional regulator [Methylophaga sp. OBS1]MCX4193651.1 LysR family transcriptional regulator [Methylophaga sp. OBS1]
MTSQFTVHGRLWIEGPDGTVLGHGRVELLEKIDALGSLSAAAAALGMSYRYAWKLVKSMNEHGDNPLITLNAGGRGGGHASLTAAGSEAVARYRQTDREFEQFLSQQSEKLPG